MASSKEYFPLIATGAGGPESDPIATAAIKTLSDAVALLPTNATITPLKNDITQLQADVLTLASKADLTKANDALALVTAAVKKLEADGGDVARKALQDAITAANAEISTLKTKADAAAQSLQKATQSIADLALLIAGGAGGSSSTALSALQTKLADLDKSKADKTALDALDTTVTGLKTAIADGATDKELADAITKVDAAILAIESALKPLTGRTLYTTTQAINVLPGDSIYIDLPGDINLPLNPPDGVEIKVFDPLRLITIGKNNIVPALGDRVGGQQGKVAINDPSPLSFDEDNQLKGGFLRLKYQTSRRSWNVWAVYGAPISVTSGGTTGGASTGGDRLVSALLALLPANQWTDWPALSGTDAGRPITLDSIQSSTGLDWTSRFELDRVQKRVRSLSAHTDVQFTYEVH